MRLRTGMLGLLAVAALAASAAGVATLVGPGREHAPRRAHAEQARERGEADEKAGPEDAYLFQRFAAGLPSGSAEPVAAGVFAQAGAQARSLARRPHDNAAAWSFEGPANIGGRIVDLVVDPTRPDSIYIATATGGVWHSSDGGSRFEPAWPASYPQSMGALAVAPDGTLYAATGEANPGGGSITYGGSGVYRSKDAGATWQRMGLEDSSTIGRLVIDPRDPSRIYAAVTGSLFNPGGTRGLYASDDGGATWRRILAPPNDTTGAVDVAVDPKNSDRVLVTMWDHIRYPDRRVYTGRGSGVWRSTDRGASFTQLSVANGLPPDSDAHGRIGVAIDPSNPQRVFAVYANDPSGKFEALFASTDGGDHWTLSPGSATLADSQLVYGWWFGRLWVDPADGSHLFLAGLNLYASTDGGTTWAPDSSVHPDQHAMAWDPRVPGRVYLGNDGGFYRSDDGGAADKWKKATYEPFSQFDNVDVSEQDPSRLSGGLQDNGSNRTWGGERWNSYYGGDGQRNLINPRDENNVFACYQYGSCARSDDGGTTMDDINTTVSDRHNYFNPMELDPTNPDVVYYAGDVVNRSTDRGRSWVPISPDLGKGEAGGEINPLYAGHYGTVTTLAVAKADPRTIWAGTDNGHLWKTTDGGSATSWTEITSPTLPRRWVSHVEVDPANKDLVYVTYTGYRGGDNGAYVFRSADGGATWSDITGNLPQAPVNCLRVVGDRLYVAGDVGVFAARARSGAVQWSTLGSGLPNAPVSWLRYVPQNRRLYASTFGRSVWSLDVRGG